MLEILDTARHDDYTGLRDQWIGDGDGFVIVYSICSRSSFMQVQASYDQIVRAKKHSVLGSQPRPIKLVGNNCDRFAEREVSTREGADLAMKLGCWFIEASAKNVINVEKAFYDVVRMIRQQQRNGRHWDGKKFSLRRSD